MTSKLHSGLFVHCVPPLVFGSTPFHFNGNGSLSVKYTKSVQVFRKGNKGAEHFMPRLSNNIVAESLVTGLLCSSFINMVIHLLTCIAITIIRLHQFKVIILFSRSDFPWLQLSAA